MIPPTPSTPPDGSGDPVNPGAPPAGPVAGPPGPVRPQAPLTGSSVAVPPGRTSRVGLTIGLGLGVLLLGVGSFVINWFAQHGGLKIAADSTTTSSAPTTTTPPAKPFAEVGDCVKLTGPSVNLKYDKVSCDAGAHNYTVSKVLGSESEQCGEDRESYTKFTRYSGLSSLHLCLIPVFADGRCYDFAFASLDAEFKTAECGGYQVLRAKVLPNTVDKAACGESPALALAYPDIKTTYCFTQTS